MATLTNPNFCDEIEKDFAGGFSFSSRLRGARAGRLDPR